jgi:ketosteroid isomerase-like protein
MFKQRAISGVCLALIMAYGLATNAAAADATVEHEIAQLEKAVNDAYAANDLDKYFSYYAEDLVAIFYNERWNYARYHEDWPKYIKAGNKVVAVKLSDMIVRVSPAGDTAVASYRMDLRNRHADGKVIDEQGFETDVWTKRQGAWKITHAQYSLAVPPPG